MRPENKLMQNFLNDNGIKATPKFLWRGSMKHSWRLHDYIIKDGKILGTEWYNNLELQNKLNALGFTDFWGKPLCNYSGNGGVFCIFTRHSELTPKFTADLTRGSW